MAHHSSAMSPAMQAAVEHLFRPGQRDGLGATGRYPEGRLTPEDSGEVRIGIADYKGRVIMDFGTSAKWIGLTPDQADAIAADLTARAAAIRAETVPSDPTTT